MNKCNLGVEPSPFLGFNTLCVHLLPFDLLLPASTCFFLHLRSTLASPVLPLVHELVYVLPSLCILPTPVSLILCIAPCTSLSPCFRVSLSSLIPT
ncbi:hypothetical protein OF83DRAFT_509109 [Amylostereum chailletii]|nr:hypothetical protein OF83DRAFT_509109 [Amylostereum chailletii]